MAEEPDGIEEAVEGGLRVALTVAGRAGEDLARRRERAARQAEAASAQEARELHARLEAERSAARASLAPVHQDEWWATADRDQIVAAYETAHGWAGTDPDAARAADRIRTEIQERYGVDALDPQADPEAVAQAMAAREQATEQTHLSVRDRERGRAEDAEAATILTHDPDARQEADATLDEADRLYDSAERREDLAASLDGVVDVETAKARVTADLSQATPPNEAVAHAPQRAARARRSRTGVSRNRDQQRAR